MAEHKSVIVKDSVKKDGMHGVIFTTRCCDDPATELSHLIDNAHWLTEDAMQYKVDYLTRLHAEQHAGMEKVETHANRLAVAASAPSAKSEPEADCGCGPK